MRFTRGLWVFLILLSVPLDVRARGKETPTENPIGWGYVRGDAVAVAPKSHLRKASPVRLGRGALVPISKWESKKGTRWARVHVVSLADREPVDGWIESSEIEEIPFDKFPTDAALRQLLGGDLLDDYAAAHSQITRFLVQRGNTGPALVCFITSPVLAAARLVAFLSISGKFVPGPSLEFPAEEIQAGIVSAEVRDLLGDGNECLITREPFRAGPETRGVNEVIRRIEGQEFQTLWKAPVEFRNLGAYPARMQVLQPPEKNIGEPGTMATGEVTFRRRGSVYEPVWKGKVEFRVVGRDEPVQSVPIEKVCPWDGARFQPL